MPSEDNADFKTLVDAACAQVVKSGSLGITAFSGMGGIGKTTLARGVYNKLVGNFVGRHGHVSFDLPYDKTDTDSQLLILLTKRFGKEEDRNRDVDSQLGVYLRKEKKPFLLLFDNVSTIEQVARIKKICKDVSDESYVLFTSRSGILFVDSECFEVNFLSKDAAYAVLCQSAGLGNGVSEPLKTAIMDVVIACGGLPLALKLVGGYMRLKNLDVAGWQVGTRRLNSDCCLVERI